MTTTVHAELSADGQRIVLMAAGPIEGVAYAARALQLATPLISKSEPPGALVLPATWPGAVQLAAICGNTWAPGPRLRDWAAEQLAMRAAARDMVLTAPVPEGLEPRIYQVEGAQVIAATGRALIFDEPRTGKTITAILGLLERSGPDGVRGLPIVAVVPASVVDPWVDAFRLWAPWWTTVAWRGAPERRRAMAGTADVYVTSYDTAIRDASNTRPNQSPLVVIDPRSLVVDECHYIKNPDAARTRAVRRLARNVQAFVALSGTPITHHADDLWPTLHCLAPGAWPSGERWRNRYLLTVPGDYKATTVGLNPYTEPEFRLTLLGQHRRVARADVMAQLPPKSYSVRTVEIPSAYRRSYDAMEHDMLAQLPDGGEISVMSVLAQLTRLSQLSCAAADVATSTEIDDNGIEREHCTVTLKAPSWKVDALLEVLDERPGERTVCFAVSAQLTRLAGEAAEKAGYRVGYVIGGQSMRKRTATIAAFQAGELDLICATTGAGGVGITLSNAGTLVFLQRPWSLVESLQAEDRAEGNLEQTRGTEIIDVIAAKTIDTRVRAVLHEKAGQLAELVQDPRIVAELLGGASVTRLNRKAS